VGRTGSFRYPLFTFNSFSVLTDKFTFSRLILTSLAASAIILLRLDAALVVSVD